MGQTKIFPIKNVANGDTAKKRGGNLVQTSLKKYNLILRYKMFPIKNVANGDRAKKRGEFSTKFTKVLFLQRIRHKITGENFIPTKV